MGDRLRSPARIDSPVSREGAFLLNNIVFAAFAFVVLLGTVFPLISEALNDDRVTVGVPYFERMTMPIGLVLLFLMAMAPVLPWRKASAETLRTRLLWPGWVGTGVLVFSVAVGARGLAPLLAFFLAGFAAGSAIRQLVLATRRQGWRGLVGRTNGGMVVHLGVIMIAVAFAASNAYQVERDARLCIEAEPGCPSTITVSGHEITFVGSRTDVSAARSQVTAEVLVDGKLYEPALQQFPNGSQQIGKPSVRNTLRTSILLSITDPPTEQRHGRAQGHRAAAHRVAVDRWRGHGRGLGHGGVPRQAPTPHRSHLGPGAGCGPARARTGAGPGGGGLVTDECPSPCAPPLPRRPARR